MTESRERPMFEYERQADGGYTFYFRPPRMPEEFGEHARNAQREVLLAIRSLLDACIEKTERDGRRSGPARKIEVS